MATELTSQPCDANGAVITFTAADASGNYFSNNGRKVLRVVNSGTSDITITIQSPTPCDQGYTHNIVATVSAGQTKDFGPFRTTRFNDSSGHVNITYSDVTNVTVALIEYIP